jgi:gamma-glutamyltranspeptidase/glutathione hydrolase
VDILEGGGNAADAVATALTLAVTYPRAGNIGGGGFAVIRLADGRATSVDFRETAPASDRSHP